jgi:membrane fusion protein (multidrug efflux system)
VAVLDGVKAGDEIVTAGQLKLHNGSPVKVSNAVTPTNEPSPTPPNE